MSPSENTDGRVRLETVKLAVTIGIIALVILYMALALLNADPEELEAASENITTPCYHFCGPWYTWIFTWLVGTFIVVAVVGGVINWRADDGD